jgi:hypothetical protein
MFIINIPGIKFVYDHRDPKNLIFRRQGLFRSLFRTFPLLSLGGGLQLNHTHTRIEKTKKFFYTNTTFQ